MVWLDLLARAGHACRVICGPSGEGAAFPCAASLEVVPVADPAERADRLRHEIAEWKPDWVLVSSEDLGHSLLREAHRSAPGRVVYLAHTPQFFPFGAESWNPDVAATALVKRSAGIVAIGEHMAEYVARSLGREVATIHPPIYGEGPWPDCSASGDGAALMLNPCAVKGIGIFLEAARRMPHVHFAAVPGWGTTSEDRAALERLPNVRLLPGAPRIDDILRHARILMMPSLWYEGFGLIVMEAMLRGIPVVASDSGGLKEAKQGTGYVIPVRTIERYESVFDEHAMPRPLLPQNSADPWIEALERLLPDEEPRRTEARASRGVAQQFVEGLDPAAFERYLSSLAPRFRILLAQNAPYRGGHGGGEISNRLLMEALAARGHDCRVVSRGSVIADRNGVHVRSVADSELRAAFIAEAATFHPDVILCSTDDPAHLLLEPALASGARVVYLVRATLALPFGPDAAFRNEAQAARLRRVDAAVGVSEYVAEYIRRYGGAPAQHVPISLMPRETWPDLARFDNEFVTIANPCAVKGIAIFLALADAFPVVRFAAVPTWGAVPADLEALDARPNITVLEPVEQLDDLLARTRVLLVPSLWAEARSRIVVEAMLRGIPVLAANTGGLPEAKMGVPYLLPVNPIVRYRPQVNERMAPIADVPPQDIGPWADALERLITDHAHYDEIARQSRNAARDYVAHLGVEPFERLLADVMSRKGAAPVAVPPAVSRPQPAAAELSPEKRALLALRLRQRAPASAYFPGAASAQPPRRFLFPAAGEFSVAREGWCVCILPGRGARLAEAPFQRMEPLIQALASAVEPYLVHHYSFLGHSFGAIVAFELACELRRRGLPLPSQLIASSARAPQFRRNHTPPPEPSDTQLLREAGLPDDAAIRHSVLPALRADTHIYRHYVYREEPPLPMPIVALGGVDDANVTRAHLDAWREQTTSTFVMRQFPGGHFYYKDRHFYDDRELLDENYGS
jgi:surfactin synthase thioesterase subunit/glycosyltransferase involved in cell wall biosynthesis